MPWQAGQPRPSAPGHAGGAFVFRLTGREPATTALLLAHLLAPVALGLSCAVMAARAAGCRLDATGCAALGTGIGLAYLVDRLREPTGSDTRSLAMRRLRAPLVAAAAVLAVVLVALASRRLDLLPELALLSGLVLAYPALARVPGGKTLAVTAAWTLGCTSLALPPGTRVPWEVPAVLALLIAAAGLLCDLKDAGRDRARGTWSVAAAAGRRATCGLAIALAAAAFALSGSAVPAARAGAVALGLLATQPRLVELELAGPALVDLALAVALLA